MSSLCDFKNFRIRLIIDLHDIGKLLNFIFTWEQRKTGIELSYDCTETPNIDSCGVRNTKYDFWSTIKSRLDVCVNSLS